MSFTTKSEEDRRILANPYLPDHVRAEAAADDSDEARLTNRDGDNLTVTEIDPVDRLMGVSLTGEGFSAWLRFTPEDMRRLAEWILDHTPDNASQ